MTDYTILESALTFIITVTFYTLAVIGAAAIGAAIYGVIRRYFHDARKPKN